MNTTRISTIVGFLLSLWVLPGCSTTIDQDTKLALKGPRAELSRKF